MSTSVTSPERTGTTAARSLADDLRSRSAPQLRDLLLARSDLAHPPPQDTTDLALRAGSVASVERALDRLDAGSLAVLEVLAASDEPCSVEDAMAGLGVTAGVAPIIETLRRQALLWGPDSCMHLVRSVRLAFGPHPAALGPPMAHGRRAVADLVADPAALHALVATAPPVAAEALRRAVWFEPVSARTPDVDWLVEKELLQIQEPETVVLPREIAVALRGGVVLRDSSLDPPELATSGQTYDLADVDRAGAAEALVALELVDALAEEWSVRPPASTRGGGLSVRDFGKLGALLGLTDAQTATLVETTYAAGLLATDGGDPDHWCPTPAYDEWAEAPTAQRWALLAATWAAMNRLPARVTGSARAEGGDARTAARVAALSGDVERPDAALLRSIVLSTLATAPHGVAPDEADLDAALRYAAPRRMPALDAIGVAELRAEAEWFGVTARGALTSYGRLLLDADLDNVAATLEAALPTQVNAFVVQADLTLVTPAPLDRDVRLELERFAHAESRGLASVYRVTDASLRSAFDGGATAERIRDFIHEHATTSVPQALDVLIDDVARRHGTLTVGGAAAYLRSSDAATLAAVLADSRLASLELSAVSDTVLISSRSPSTVLERLRASGHAPAAEGVDGNVLVLRPTPRRGLASAPPRRREGAVDSLVNAIVRSLTTDPEEHVVVDIDVDDGDADARGLATVLRRLQDAISQGRAATIAYADGVGAQTERVVEPLSLEAGFLTAYDLTAAQVRTFTVSRISAVH